MTNSTSPTPHPEKAPFPDGSGRGRENWVDWCLRYRALTACSLREARDACDAGRPMPEGSDAINSERSEHQKRAALESAAPDMFEALKILRDHCEHAHLREIADAALSKATGGQHV